MIKLALSASLVVLALFSKPANDCVGCNVVKSNTVNAKSLVVTWPSMERGSCVECPACGECDAKACEFDGVFELWNDCGVLGPTLYFKKNNQTGYGTLTPGARLPVEFTNDKIDCGKVDVFDSWHNGEEAIAGEVRIGCSACPEGQGQ